ncbi:MAG TPA: hypothetical protein VFA90_10040 [Terriglobales bacterium]|nr:hypothetical protein [Terriglobales bacterium]
MWNSPLRRVLLPVGVLLFLISGGCTGFFVNQPNSITVTQAGSSTLSVASGSTAQLTATGSFDSGTKDVTNSATWQSSSACATVSSTGLVTGVGAVSDVTITATLAGVSGSISGSVTGGSGQTLSVNPPTTSFTTGDQATYTAILNGTDVTASTTWASSDTTVVSFSGNVATFVGAGTATITASFVGNGTCATGAVTVTVQ